MIISSILFQHAIATLTYTSTHIVCSYHPGPSLVYIDQLKCLWSNDLGDKYAINEISILHQKHINMSRYSEYSIYEDTGSSVKQYNPVLKLFL